MSRACTASPFLALLVYGLALLQPSLPPRLEPPPSAEVKCACSSVCGCWVVGHGDTDTGTATECHLYGVCGCGCCDGGPAQHHMGGRQIPPHLQVALPHPSGAATIAVRALPGMPTPYSVCVKPPDKIPI